MGLTSTERPILFSGAMVRAILERRKTQTRRVVKHPAIFRCGAFEFIRDGLPLALVPDTFARECCPYGTIGDRMWLRETFAWHWCERDPEKVIYRANGECCGDCGERIKKWRPSIFMPRALSRTALEIRGVRVERLQDIGDADAIAEGIDPNKLPETGWLDYSHPESPFKPQMTAVGSYRTLWDSINAKRGFGWDLNPWVWVIEFRREFPKAATP